MLKKYTPDMRNFNGRSGDSDLAEGRVGTILVDESNIGNGRILKFNSETGMLEYGSDLAGSGDFLADGSVPMTGDFKLGGKDIWLNAAGTSKIANDGSDNFEWSLLAGKTFKIDIGEGTQVFEINEEFVVVAGLNIGGLAKIDSGADFWFENEYGNFFLGVNQDAFAFRESGVSSLTARNAKTSLVGVINEINAAVGTQSANIADPSGGATIDAEARTAINAILDVLETFKAMATA